MQEATGDFGIQEAEFWDMNPAAYGRIQDGHRRRELRERHYRALLGCAMVKGFVSERVNLQDIYEMAMADAEEDSEARFRKRYAEMIAESKARVKKQNAA